MISEGGATWKRFGHLFTIPRIRRANFAAGIVMISQQMCRKDIIMKDIFSSLTHVL